MSGSAVPRDFLFDPERLRRYVNEEDGKFDKISANLPSNLVLRPLQLSDHSRSYMELLAEHTKAPTVPFERFQERFNLMKAYGDIYYIVVIEDFSQNKIVATGTLEIEHKFIHSLSLRGRLEEIVVHQENKDYRYTDGNLASIILEVLTTLGKSSGVIKSR